MHRIPHSTYYQDRCSEYELCHDFPGDEILIDGLHAMQCHFRSNHVAIDIPVVRVMNTAHFLASYMFSTECSGDRLEYDAMAHNSMGRDRQLVPLTIIVLAAMLQRTTGFRAKQCRNVILENRDPDFEEGVTLYDRFLRSAEKHFAEEDFLIDTQVQIVRLKEENIKLTSEIIQLKYTITTMEKERPQTIVYNYGTFNDIHDNPNSTIYTMTPPEQAQKEPVMEEKPVTNNDPKEDELFRYIHYTITSEAERLDIHRQICNIVRLPKMQLVCDALLVLMKSEKILSSIDQSAMLTELRRLGLPAANTSGFSDQNFYSYYRTK